MALLSAKGELPSSKEFPRWERENEVRNQLPQFFISLHEGPTSVSHYPETDKAKTNKDRLEQGRMPGAPNISYAARAAVVYSSVQDPNSFRHWRNQSPGQLPWTPCRFHHCDFPPQVHLDGCHLTDSLPVPNWTLQSALEVSLAFAAAEVQDASLDPCSWSTAMHAFGANPFSCGPVRHWSDSCHWPPTTCKCLWWGPVAIELHVDS